VILEGAQDFSNLRRTLWHSVLSHGLRTARDICRVDPLEAMRQTCAAGWIRLPLPAGTPSHHSFLRLAG
jgi:hypothetical protein